MKRITAHQFRLSRNKVGQDIFLFQRQPSVALLGRRSIKKSDYVSSVTSRAKTSYATKAFWFFSAIVTSHVISQLCLVLLQQP